MGRTVAAAPNLFRLHKGIVLAESHDMNDLVSYYVVIENILDQPAAVDLGHMVGDLEKQPAFADWDVDNLLGGHSLFLPFYRHQDLDYSHEKVC